MLLSISRQQFKASRCLAEYDPMSVRLILCRLVDSLPVRPPFVVSVDPLSFRYRQGTKKLIHEEPSTSNVGARNIKEA